MATSNASTYVLNNVNLGTSQTLVASVTAPSTGTYVVIAGGYYGASGTAITNLNQRISVNGTEKSFAQNSENYLNSNQYNLGFKFIMWTGSVNAGDTIQYYAYKGAGTLTAGKVTLAAFRVS